MDDIYYKVNTKDSKEARFVIKQSVGNKRKRKVLHVLAKAVNKAKRNKQSYIVGWKKVRSLDGLKSLIAQLHIPVNAQMRCPMNRKCRASRVKVVALYSVSYENSFPQLGGLLHSDIIAKPYNKGMRSTRYQAGEWVRPENKFAKYNTECASGIHFFLNVNHALRW